jgi:hypothetical protein
MQYVQQRKDQANFNKAFESFLATLEQEVTLYIKKQTAVIEKATQDAGALLDEVGENIKKMASVCTLLSKGKFPMEVPENEKDITRINVAAEIAHIVEQNSSVACQSLDTLMEQEQALHDISQRVSRVFYNKLYQTCLKKQAKPMVMFNAQGLIATAEQKELLPAILK